MYVCIYVTQGTKSNNKPSSLLSLSALRVHAKTLQLKLRTNNEYVNIELTH